MGSRTTLQTLLETLLGSGNVYFQPPPNFMMQYPCIVYKLNAMSTKYANNLIYNTVIGYQVTVIDGDPDSEIPGKIIQLPMCTFERHYASDNLNHTSFNLYY